MYYQQGDVLLKPAAISAKAVKLDSDLIHKGENHHHRMRGDFELYQDGQDLIARCLDDCELYHEEHKTLVIPKGIYRKGIVMEYDHIDEESRQVLD